MCISCGSFIVLPFIVSSCRKFIHKDFLVAHGPNCCKTSAHQTRQEDQYVVQCVRRTRSARAPRPLGPPHLCPWPGHVPSSVVSAARSATSPRPLPAPHPHPHPAAACRISRLWPPRLPHHDHHPITTPAYMPHPAPLDVSRRKRKRSSDKAAPSFGFLAEFPIARSLEKKEASF